MVHHHPKTKMILSSPSYPLTSLNEVTGLMPRSRTSPLTINNQPEESLGQGKWQHWIDSDLPAKYPLLSRQYNL